MSPVGITSSEGATTEAVPSEKTAQRVLVGSMSIPGDRDEILGNGEESGEQEHLLAMSRPAVRTTILCLSK